MPFNKAFREKQQELKEKNKVIYISKGIISSYGSKFPEDDIHCKEVTIGITGKLDKYGKWQRI